ncbi:MAG TPA: cysteine dioxygenase family protein [Thermoanaerobaculia bacterium]|nr:cysteine dioxygenase family protein [Thermoanaerobaculia bacterium]
MATQAVHGVDELIGKLAAAARLGDPAAITERVKDELEAMLGNGGLALPERCRETRTDRYARHLLHSDPAGWSAVVMTWAPGQRTPLHDHAGLWCVEGVIEGRMEVLRYELLDEDEGICRFAPRGRLVAGVGEAGALIPPYDYHVLGNSQNRTSLTLHVYGGTMDHCSVFEPLGEDLFRRRVRTLVFDD